MMSIVVGSVGNRPTLDVESPTVESDAPHQYLKGGKAFVISIEDFC